MNSFIPLVFELSSLDNLPAQFFFRFGLSGVGQIFGKKIFSRQQTFLQKDKREQTFAEMKPGDTFGLSF